MWFFDKKMAFAISQRRSVACSIAIQRSRPLFALCSFENDDVCLFLKINYDVNIFSNAIVSLLLSTSVPSYLCFTMKVAEFIPCFFQ